MYHSEQIDYGMLSLRQQSGPSLAMLQGCVMRPVLPHQSSDLANCPGVSYHQLSTWLSISSVCHRTRK